MTENQIILEDAFELPLSLSPTLSLASNEPDESSRLDHGDSTSDFNSYCHSGDSDYPFPKVQFTPRFNFNSEDHDLDGRTTPMSIKPQLLKWSWSLESLPPMRLSPSSDGESGQQDPIVFVAPRGTRIMSESDLLPYEPTRTAHNSTLIFSTIKKNKSCLDIPSKSQQTLSTEEPPLRPLMGATIITRGRPKDAKPLIINRDTRIQKRRVSMRDGPCKARFSVGGDTDSEDE
jgi:hypothetical protein